METTAVAIKNELGMKPNSTRRMFADTCNNLEDLKLAIAKIEMVSGQNAEIIDIGRCDIELEAECMTDGSVVYNVFLNPPQSWQG